MIENPRRLRSRLHFELLALFVGHVAVPVALAELWIAAKGVKSLMALVHRDRSTFYTYMHRLADHGWVRIERVHDRLAVLLTSEGERELERFKRWGGRAGFSLVPTVAESSEPAPDVVRRAFQRVGGSVRQTRAFVSYDVPVEAEVLRRALSRALSTAGFDRMHESMWVGDPRRLPAVVAWAERHELLPQMTWGAIQVFSGTDTRGIAPRVSGRSMSVGV